MNDIISIIILLAVYLIGLIFIVLIFNDIDITSKKRKYEKTERSDNKWQFTK